MDIGQLDRLSGPERGDLAGEFARAVDRFAVDAGDDVAGRDAGRCRGRIGLRFRDQRALGRFQAEAVGDFLRHRLNLHADIAARDRAPFLQRGDDVLGDFGREWRSRCRRCRPTARRWRC